MRNKDLIVEYKGMAIKLNNRLLDVQDKWEVVEPIKDLHLKKLQILYQMEHTNDSSKLIEYADIITQIEFDLQSLWGFPQDAKWHKFWKLPKCTCPKMDNDDRYPTGYYVINASCPIHNPNLSKIKLDK